ncbi:MAG: hypothetical protein ABJA98_15940 [Acidobacteriota bacterium]
MSFASYFTFHRLCRPTFSDDDKFVVLTTLGVVATIHSLLLAFLAVSVWEAFGSAETAVVQEANTIGELGRDLAVFDTDEVRHARRLLRDYTDKVVKVGWVEMSRGGSREVWNEFDRMFLSIGRLAPDTPRRIALLPEIWARTDELLKQRRYTTQAAVPSALWAVVVIGSVLTIAMAFALMPTRLNLTMVFSLALSIGLVFFVIIAMDRPFAGRKASAPSRTGRRSTTCSAGTPRSRRLHRMTGTGPRRRTTARADRVAESRSIVTSDSQRTMFRLQLTRSPWQSTSTSNILLQRSDADRRTACGQVSSAPHTPVMPAN